MKIISDYSLEQLSEILTGFGEPKFRAKQIFRAVHQGKRFKDMTDLKISLRERLEKEFVDNPCEIIEELISKDGTRKYLFRLYDGNIIEGVLMKYKYGYTQCVSTQVGCRMGCAFCASTLGGLVRNLSQGEIIGQILEVNKRIGGNLDKRAITNVVLMGSGEPFDNYENVLGFLRLISSPDGINISPRNISISTCGIVPKMLEIAKENLPINLTVSLHSPFDEKRKKIMPIAKAYSIKEVIDACRNYFEITKRRVYFEYSLINGENDTKECADKLCELLRGFPCHVNLIKLNAVKETGLKSTGDKRAQEFMKILEEKGISVTIRRSMGADIEGACGQLRRKFLGNKD